MMIGKIWLTGSLFRSRILLPPRPLRGWVTGGLQRCSLLHSITMIAMSINNIIFTLLSSIFNEAESRMGQDQCSRHRHQHNFINIISHRHPYPYISKEATISMRGAEWFIRKTRGGIEFLNSSSIGPKNLVPWKQLWRWIKETNYIFEFKGDCFTFPFRIPWAMVCSNSNKRIVRMPWLTTRAHFSESLKCLSLSQVVQAQPLNRKLIAYLCTGTTKSRFSRKRTFFLFSSCKLHFIYLSFLFHLVPLGWCKHPIFWRNVNSIL